MQHNKKQIIFVHQYNDRSGSPRVLATVIDTLKEHANLMLYVGSAGAGLLDDAGIPTKKFAYIRTSNKYLNAVSFFISQVVLLIKLFLDKNISKDATIYVNTILPFGAAIFGFLTSRRVVYHLHEVSLSPRMLMSFLVAVAKRTASKLIYVSKYHLDALPFKKNYSQVVSNAVDERLYAESKKNLVLPRSEKMTILMLASLRDYKGVPELLRLSAYLEEFDSVEIILVVNAGESEIDRYFKDKLIPRNLAIHPSTSETWNYYARADLLLNLSRVDQWVETFGMTIIEAMCFGVPSIAPPVGGPEELIQHGINGYLIDSRNTAELHATVRELIIDSELLEKMKVAAKATAINYVPDAYSKKIREFFELNK